MAPAEPPMLGWIGLGSMGLGMAKNLQKHLKSSGLPSLCFTNRTMSRGKSLEELGGQPLPTIAEIVQKSDIIFSSLSDDPVLESVVKEILASGSIGGKIIVDTSTVHPDTTIRVSKALSESGAFFVAAPVFGASPVAEAAQVLFIIAGPKAGTDAISPFIKGVMGRGSIELGEDVSKASLMKTSGNFITAAMMEMISEAHVFAEKSGLGSEALEALVKENYGPLAYSMSKRLTTGAYAPGPDQRPMSNLTLAIKDVGHGISCAQNAGTRLKTAEVALDHLKQAKEYADSKGGRDLDSSSMYGIIRRDAGLDFESDVVKERDA